MDAVFYCLWGREPLSPFLAGNLNHGGGKGRGKVYPGLLDTHVQSSQSSARVHTGLLES